MVGSELKPARLEICPYGDMEIVLKTPTIDATYLVSSVQLKSSSSYFRAMLGPHYAEGGKLLNTTSGPTDSLLQVTAEDEFNPIALATVLYALHARPECVPRFISPQNLLDVAIVCNYYDCAGAIQPWKEHWIDPHRSLAPTPGYEYWLFISWVLGDRDIFESLSSAFSRNGVIVDGEFGVMVAEKVVRMDSHLPPSIIEAMKERRSELGEDIARACCQIYTSFEDNAPRHKCKVGNRHCKDILFAGLHRGFKSKNLLAADAKRQAHLTLDSILADVKSASDMITDSEARSWAGFSRGRSHHPCNPLSEILQSLQGKLNGIEPLRLEKFSQWQKQPYKYTWDGIFQEARARGSVDAYPTSLAALRFNICPGGDMYLVLMSSTTTATYRISYNQLRVCSPILCNLVSSQSWVPESTVKVEKELDPTALAVVLYAIHAAAYVLPSDISFANLVDIAVVCDYFQCASTLMPWAEKWMANWANALTSGQPGYEDGLLVSWVFGVEDAFRRLTKLFAESGFVKNGEFVIAVDNDPQNFKKLHQLIPQAILDSIAQQRNEAGRTIAKMCRELYEKYESDKTTQCANESLPTRTRKFCDHFVFAELHMGFKTTRLLARDFSDNIPLDTSVGIIIRDLTQLFKDIASHAIFAESGIHDHCRSVEDQVTVLENAQLHIEMLELDSFGTEKSAIAWEGVMSI